ncbi:MAG TPA: HEAT repeat domain-containing protein [Treponemataceae bacterium]|nr:HEAT repeat domain-containing protein [Treponemataceae bacterium]
MKYSKITCIFLVTLCMSVIVFAQEVVTTVNEPRSEITVEQEYLSTIEDVIIKELANSDNLDTKFVALQHIETALEEGRLSPQIEISLQSLAGEGVLKESRTANRLSNNYPQIRSKAADLLGQTKTKAAKETLLKIAVAENEPMVLSSVVRSLGKIGLNDSDDVANTIAWVERRFSILNPTDSLAYEVLDAYEALLPTVDDKTQMIECIASIAGNYRYVTPIRTKALDLLKKLTTKGIY